MHRTVRKTHEFWKYAALIMVLLVFMFASVIPVHADGPVMTPIGDPDAEPPKITAHGAAMYSLQLDKFVYVKNENERMSPYSITKLLTCYLALENLPEDKVVTVSSNATRTYENGTTIWLKTGEKITVGDLVYGALLASGNDAAYALGEAVSGNEKDFAALMNKTVEEWGCKDTHFVNANGWKNADHYTTAHDMCIITMHCLSNERLLEMSGEKKHTLAATNMTDARALDNHMRFTTKSAQCITGGKTGSWDEDDCSIALEFDDGTLSGVIVLLGDTKKARGKDVIKLIEFAPVVTPGFMVSDTGDLVDTARVRHGAETRVDLYVDGQTLAYPASNSEEDITVETNIDNLEAPLAKGDPAGTYTVYVDGEKLAEHGLCVAADVETGWFPSYLYISNKQTMVIGAVLAVLILLIIVMSAIRKRKNRSAYEGRHSAK